MDHLQIDADVLEKAAQERRIARKQETKELVIQELKQESETKAEADIEMPDDTDDLESDEAIEAWKERERARVLRDKLLRENELLETQEIDRRRCMTDLEIIEENKKLGLHQRQEKQSIKFLQRYYHKGAFYRGDEEVEEAIVKRDLLAPVGYDKEVDISMLPKVMQVKDFGLAGRTKCLLFLFFAFNVDTHLADQDTTNTLANPWSAAEREFGIRRNAFKKQKFG